MWSSLFLATLRSSALLLKFCLYLYLASFAGAEMLGWLGLLTACTIMYSAIGDGCVLQTIARDSVTTSFKTTLYELRLYLRCIPYFFICILIIGMGLVVYGVNWLLIFLSVALVFSELLNNNFFILLMNQQRPYDAQLLYVVRSGLWIPVFIGITFYNPDFLTLEFLLGIWSCVSACVAAFLILKLKLFGTIKRGDISTFAWLLTKIKKSTSLLKLNFLMALNDCAASFILSLTLGVEKLGIYTYFQQVASAMMNIIRFGIIQPLWPGLIKLYQEANIRPLEIQKKHLLVVMVLSLLGSFVAYPAYYYLGQWLGHGDFQSYFSLFIPILLLFVVSSFGCLQDAVFYSVKKEGVLNVILMIVLPINILMIFLMGQIAGLYGVVWGTVLIAGAVVVYKQVRLIKIPALI